MDIEDNFVVETNNEIINNGIINNEIINNEIINNEINKEDIDVLENKKDYNNVVEKKDAKVKLLLSKINNIKLNNEQYIEIYKIIKMDAKIKIMTNKNGVFVDLQYLDKSILNKLELFIHYISTNELSQNII
tara:strand:- start:177 stop:572 length:396 start_codon:yes stop_codon:yes gene_type:complete